MFVESLLGTAAKRLVAVNDDIALIEAARPPSQLNVDLVVVCKPDGELAGIISKTDVVREICIGSRSNTTASQVIARDVVLCYPTDSLSDVWEHDKRSAAEESSGGRYGFMRDYVMSVGYQ